MNARHLQPWKRLGVLAAIALTVALGNLRSTASVAAAPATAAAPTSEALGVAMGSAMLSRAAASTPPEPEDEARLVPAVYARDPDVRFVFFRNVSKWM